MNIDWLLLVELSTLDVLCDVTLDEVLVLKDPVLELVTNWLLVLVPTLCVLILTTPSV